MKTLGSGKTGRREVKFAKNALHAIRLAFICGQTDIEQKIFDWATEFNL